MTADRLPPGVDFAAQLRERRRVAGLTQAELASLAGVAVRTVRDVERGRTARPQRTTAMLLARALRLAGRERAEFLAAARGAGGRAVPPPAAAGTPLPPLPELFGREWELSRLSGLIAEPVGPLTLVGLAGVGKTALAIAFAHRVAAEFPGGVAGIVVDEEGGDPADLLDAIASAFGAARPDGLVEQFAGAPALLLLDAADRAPAKVRAAVARLPSEVRVLATALAPLGLSSERTWPVSPLDTPPTSVERLAEVSRYPAAALFLARLARARPEPLASDELPALVALVRRLGGLPLALELAAAHGRLLRLPEILRRYGARVLDLRGAGVGGADLPPLRAVVAASYRLLTPVERRALRRLAAFRNRWSAELAEQLLPGPGDPMPVLDRLVNLGLVNVRGAREHRFRLLDVVREFATEQAAKLGELTGTRRAHAAVIAAFATRTVPPSGGPGLPAAVARLDDLAADIWSALNHAANDDPPTALRLAAALPPWWRSRGREEVGHRWLRRLLDDPRTAGVDPGARAWAAVGAAQLSHPPAELAEVERVLPEFARMGDVTGELAALGVLHAGWRARGRPERARAHAEAALALAMRAGRPREAALAQVELARYDERVGDLDAARRRWTAADRLAAQSGDLRLRLLAGAGRAEEAERMLLAREADGGPD